jgi:arylsulfatase A-like enzyme
VNLVVYVSDALRIDYVGCYGARFVNTRTIDELASTGVRFDEAISAAPWTCPSMTSILTGLYPHHHGCLHWDAELPVSTPTLFSLAEAAGYATASVVFDERYLYGGLPAASVIGTSESLDTAIEWLRANRSRPFLLLVHSWATHMPYGVAHAERGEWRAAKAEILAGIQEDSARALEALREAYTQAVERQSEVLLASFLEELERLGLRELTALAFLSDHGESWGERYEDKTAVRGVYYMHGATLHEEIVRVPLIVSAPSSLEPRVVWSQVRTVDLMPTLLELAGVAVPALDGRSLVPLAAGREEGDRLAVIAGTDAGALSQLAVRLPPWKLVHHATDGREEAYRLDLDPRERTSCPADVPGELREALYGELETVPGGGLSEEEAAIITARLSDLGYL